MSEYTFMKAVKSTEKIPDKQNIKIKNYLYIKIN